MQVSPLPLWELHEPLAMYSAEEVSFSLHFYGLDLVRRLQVFLAERVGIR